MRGIRRLIASALAGLGVTLGAVVGCASPDPVRIVLLVPDDDDQRWLRVDAPAFIDLVEATCDGCVVTVSDAGGDPAVQATQVAEAAAAGAGVLVIAAVDPAALTEAVADVGIPIISFSRRLPGVRHHVGTDPVVVGELQGEALVAADAERVLLVHGPASDPEAVQQRDAVREVLARAGVEIVGELEAGSPGQVSEWVASRWAERRVDAIHAADDVLAAAVIDALRAAGVRRLPVVTGAGAELDAVRRIVAGEQTMTVLPAAAAEAERAAELAVATLTRESAPVGQEVSGVDTHLFEPRAVTVGSLADTVLRSRFLGVAEICEGDVARRCTELGLR
ncbi:substrate-binding domain-containing protein [Nocardioides limicola]|uniref:substrate-binding domain-containing protein n=1 Tax=Nocardioides limicola TaxID=2803368 RepID=UPI00193BB73B|nr:substrate-binding domain-containing protein [Nocardioides sp. DJM-14]